jgi:hypothetical protein
MRRVKRLTVFQSCVLLITHVAFSETAGTLYHIYVMLLYCGIIWNYRVSIPRGAATTARKMLSSAAALTWDVPRSTCTADNSRVKYAASNQEQLWRTRVPRLKYAALSPCPTIGGKVTGFDDNESKKISGLSYVGKISDSAG